MEAKIKDNGGVVRGGVWRKTNYLLVGEQNRAVVKDKENKSPQEIKAEELIAGGYPIEILRSLEELEELIG